METGDVVCASSTRAVGWRVWTVREGAEGVRLGSVIHEAMWTPGSEARATCSLGLPHVAPDAGCSCGFYAARDPVDAFSYLHGRNEPGTISRILGEVVLSGHVVQTERGWRASGSYPLRLYVGDPEIAIALASYAVPILFPECGSAIATSSKTDSAGSPTSSCSAVRMRSLPTDASG
jgi:hypothetical protein